MVWKPWCYVKLYNIKAEWNKRHNIFYINGNVFNLDFFKFEDYQFEMQLLWNIEVLTYTTFKNY